MQRDDGRTTIVQRLALVAFGVVAALVTLEVGLRLAGVVWMHARERESAAVAAMPGDVVRVLCLGESTTALGGEHSYPRELERTLNARGGPRRFAVVNAGIPGATTDVILGRLAELLDRHRPHVVVTMLGVNDGLVLDERLPGFDSWRIVKLVHLLVRHHRPRADLSEAPPVFSPIVAGAMDAFRAGRHAEAEAMLRAQMGLAAPRDVVWAMGTMLAWLERWDEAEATFEGWLATHDDLPMRELLWTTRLRHVHWIIDRREFDRAQIRLAALERDTAPGAPQLRALVLAERAALAEARGERDAATRYRDEADGLRTGSWAESTERNYRQLVRIVRERGIALFAMQYPLRSVGSLRALLGDPSDVAFVDTAEPFRRVLGDTAWDVWFTDMFAGDFGHTTPAGARLIAATAANAILEHLEAMAAPQWGGLR